MTPAQIELLRSLSREELLAAVGELVMCTSDHQVVLAVMHAVGRRAERLGRAWIAASEAELAALRAWQAKPGGARLHRAYVDASEAEKRARRAADRAHTEHCRLVALPIPLPAPKGAAAPGTRGENDPCPAS